MDSNRFDHLARTLGSRRTLLNGIVATGVAALLRLRKPEEAVAHNALPACRRIKNNKRRAACVRRARRHNASHGSAPPPGGCTPNCAGKNCGGDGCGGSCGTCSGGRVCSNPANGGTCRCPAVTCAGICCSGGQQCFGTDCWPDGEEAALVTLINNYRVANGRPALALQNQLGAAAELHSQDQAAHNTSSHLGSDGSTPAQRLTRQGYAFSAEAENIYWNSGSGAASAAFDWWRNSPGHNANMLSTNVTQFGIGRARSSAGAWYWTTSFARPA